jgi:hypothetical protein
MSGTVSSVNNLYTPVLFPDIDCLEREADTCVIVYKMENFSTRRKWRDKKKTSESAAASNVSRNGNH